MERYHFVLKAAKNVHLSGWNLILNDNGFAYYPDSMYMIEGARKHAETFINAAIAAFGAYNVLYEDITNLTLEEQGNQFSWKQRYE